MRPGSPGPAPTRWTLPGLGFRLWVMVVCVWPESAPVVVRDLLHQLVKEMVLTDGGEELQSAFGIPPGKLTHHGTDVLVHVPGGGHEEGKHSELPDSPRPPLPIMSPPTPPSSAEIKKTHIRGASETRL